MKVKITERGAHGPKIKQAPKGYAFEVGKVYDIEEIYEHLHNIKDWETVEDDEGRLKIPSYLVGKCVVIGEEAPADMDTEGKTAVTNPAKGGKPEKTEKAPELSEAQLARQKRLVEIVKSLDPKEDFTKDGAAKMESINTLVEKGEEQFTAEERDLLIPIAKA